MRRVHFIFAVLLILTGALLGDDLVLEKLYPDIPLIGIPPENISWSPDESMCAFLWNSESERTKN